MPFGNESTWDPKVKNTKATKEYGHQCLSATSPLGTHRPHRIRIEPILVTNAFRQQVHLGLINWENIKLASWVTNAFRQRVHLDAAFRRIPRRSIRVTNAFRQRVHLGQASI